MVRRSLFLSSLALLLGAGPSAGQAPAVSLDEALRFFASNNLELRLARSEALEAGGLARQAAAFPNPSVNATHEPLRGGGRSYSETYLTVSQRLEIGGSRGARSSAGERRLEAARMRLRADSIRLAFEVKRAFVEASRAQGMLDVTGRITEVFRSAANSARDRYASGDISLYAARRIAMERARYETLLADAELEVDERQSSLALLISPEGDDERIAATALPAPTPPPAPRALLATNTIGRRAELDAAQAELEEELAEARLSRSERIPDLTATGGFKRQSDGLRGAYVGVSFPVPFFDRGGGAIDASDAGAQAAQERLALTRRQVENEVIHAIDTYSALTRRAGLVTGLDDQESGDLLDIALVAYDEGEMELVELLDAASALYEARRAETSLQSSLWIAYFDLERAVGGFDDAPGAEVEQ
jgi:cobalt-zinc-cadmium efflux system outer membrane protein